jgi:uncharacterized protein YeaC (DUF1315 family)
MLTGGSARLRSFIFCRQLLVKLPEGVKVEDMEDQVSKAATLLRESKHNEQAAERWKGEAAELKKEVNQQKGELKRNKGAAGEQVAYMQWQLWIAG